MTTKADLTEATKEITEAPSSLMTESPFSSSARLTAKDLPNDILGLIFDLLSLRDLLSCAGVCQRWRQLVTTSPRWRLFQLGQNFDCHAEDALSEYVVSLSRLKDVKPSSAVPLRVPAPMLTFPLKMVCALLSNGSNLRELDLSAMRLSGEQNQREFEDVWTRGAANADELRSLALPQNYAPSCDFLKAVFIAHPHLEKLALSSGSAASVYDPEVGRQWRERPFMDVARRICEFASNIPLKHLDIRREESLPAPPSFECFATNLLRGVESLSIVGLEHGPDLFDSVLQIQQFGQSATQLQVLHIGLTSFDSLELILHYCRQLKMIRVDHVHGYSAPDPLNLCRPIQSATDISQCLSSVDLGLSGPWSRTFGLSRLLKNLGFCSNLREISLVPAGVKTGPLLSASDFTFALSERPELWTKVTALFVVLNIGRSDQLQKIGDLLAKLPRLKTVYLELSWLPTIASWSGSQHVDTVLAIESLNVQIAEYGIPRGFIRPKLCLRPLKCISRSWMNVAKLTITLKLKFPEDHANQDKVSLNELCAKFSLLWDLREVCLTECGLLIEPQLSPDSVSKLSNVTCLKLLRGVKFEAESLSNLVKFLPAIEVFILAEDGYKPSSNAVVGLTLSDLSVVSGWKNLRECVLVVDVSLDAIAHRDVGAAEEETIPPDANSFLELNDAHLVPRLVAEWKRDLNRLERMEAIARVIYPRNDNLRPVIRYYSLVHLVECSLGKLHACYSRGSSHDGP